MSQAPAQLPFGRVTPHDPGNARRSPWRPQVTRGESRVSVAGAVVVISGLQMTLPERLSPRLHWLLPALEVLLLGVLVAAQPGRMDRRSPRLRAGGLALVGLLSVANAISAALLVGELVRGGDQEPAGALLFAGVSIWTTNVLVFALWYWELDRGGPVDRCHATRAYPDFLFMQMQAPELAPPDWKPTFVDYVYLSFTNATAFAPSDVVPLSRWAKLMMTLQSVVSVATVALVIARAVDAFN
jgi:uncharacterized membrane protein